jgi:hypothetical protein
MILIPTDFCWGFDLINMLPMGFEAHGRIILEMKTILLKQGEGC